MKITLLLILMSSILLSCSSEREYPQPNLIPQPQIMSLEKEFVKFEELEIILKDNLTQEAQKLREYFPVLEEGEDVQLCRVFFEKDTVKNPYGFEGAYSLSIGSDILVKANDDAGIFYGIQTLRQLMAVRDGSYILPKGKIEDWPAFKVRGFMHDVGRNYMSVDLLKQQLEIMANYKYNVFHFHVTENPGWRLESKIYPQLQDGATFSRKPGQFYTQKEFKELVRFCSDRHITLIPEFDIPGHSHAFRKAFNLTSMNTPKVQEILINLIDELCSLAPAVVMPYIHLGTDEVRHQEERVGKGFLDPVAEAVYKNGREVIGWRPGMDEVGGERSIKQLWTGAVEPLTGHRFIDSRANYINHIDPLASLYRFMYQQPCGQPHGDDLALGGVLCLWHDNNIVDEMNFFRQNPTYPSLVMYSDAIWRGKKDYNGRKYWAQMPAHDTPDYMEGASFEDKVIAHRNKYFKGIPFPYVKHAHIPWKIIGPFDHQGDMKKRFPVEIEMKDTYDIDGKSYSWSDSTLYGGTVHLKHFFGFPSPVKEKNGTVYATTNIYSPKEQTVGFWIGFHGWSRAGGRRGGPTPQIGQWHTTNPQIWMNDKEIAPPNWQQPGLGAKVTEIPWVDEDYFYRKPTPVLLKKGWNKVLLKVPHGGTSWKWMFTCVPVEVIGDDVREVEGLEFSAEL
ncbi:hypothetical protein EYV94_11630 [Puteibacter caeruleilacunae]|nr:hypothetical protein EYV94_11630 [Puteibacter caeruleilacunae]